MHPYATETFSEAERHILRRLYDEPRRAGLCPRQPARGGQGRAFCSLFALRKEPAALVLGRVVGDLDVAGDTSLDATIGLRRAEELYERVFGDFGDDSVAQLGGRAPRLRTGLQRAHEGPRVGKTHVYLEQSTRYIPYVARLANGHYRYYRDPAILDSPMGARYVGEMDRMFDTYGALLRSCKPTYNASFLRRVRSRTSHIANRSAPGRWTACADYYGWSTVERRPLWLWAVLRALVAPHAGSCTSGGAALRRNDARRAAQGDPVVLDARRPARPRRCVEHVLDDPTRRDADLVGSLWADEPGAQSPSVDLVDFDPAGEDKVLAAMCYPFARLSEAELARRVDALSPAERGRIFATYVGERRESPPQARPCA